VTKYHAIWQRRQSIHYEFIPVQKYGSRRMLTEVLEKNWKREGPNTSLRKTRETGSNDQRHETGRVTEACS